jgi:hypothetical protein
VRHRHVFLARYFVKPFGGFADDQRKGDDWKQRARQEGQRPESEEKFGYDVQAAIDALRLL